MLTVRTYRRGDRVALRELFASAGRGSPTESLWGDPASEAAVYLDPYLDAVPDSVWLAERDDRLIGYLVGCPSPDLMPSEDARLAAAIRQHRLLRNPTARRFFVRSVRDMAVATLRRKRTAGEFHDERWPAHLHLDVVESARGSGAAEGLVRHFLSQLKEQGVPGCHLQTVQENERAVRFFRRMGFTPHGEVAVVPGVRHRGGPVHQLTMVRTME
ncbi:ribosomal protein S18 acetylase RimI-like enzyme [Prauserella isguenensis]|uniref:Ribosomal protein S18 acetylase RimI-like enzyme n=1 Tax=Prauserella isguenensis TaxID=1470180 RepID=A0A839RZW3_9PSEU|nr:GNAT family N-acetyltransferase [Prauserella isguenensis]MBB3050037.1 ribosomal protein S18 acetylase RimI-like enzyme [Prauserella isguenensis]